MGKRVCWLFCCWVVAFLTGIIAEKYGVTPILLSWNWNFDSRIFAYATFVKDTRHFVHKEAISSAVNQKKHNVFIETTFKQNIKRSNTSRIGE
jgi:hypothetical protein